jgi:thymidylate synthase
MMFEDVWHDLLRDLTRAPRVNRRGSDTSELLNVSRTWEAGSSYLSSKGRNMSSALAKAEALAILTGRNDVESLKKHAPTIGRFSDNGIVFTGAYGPQWIAQRAYIIDTLMRDPFTRQAVLTIWQPRPSRSADIPCTVSWQFMLVDGRLDMFINMRSSDIWLGLPYDAFTWAVVLKSLALELGYNIGNIHYHAATCHLYARNIDSARIITRGAVGCYRQLPWCANIESLVAWLS